MTACPLGLASQCYCENKVSSFGSAKSPAKAAVLLLAHGSPASGLADGEGAAEEGDVTARADNSFYWTSQIEIIGGAK